MQKSIKKYFHVSQFFDLCNARIIEIINSDGSNPIGSICQKELKMYYYTLEYIQGHFNFRATILLKLDPHHLFGDKFNWTVITISAQVFFLTMTMTLTRIEEQHLWKMKSTLWEKCWRGNIPFPKGKCLAIHDIWRI